MLLTYSLSSHATTFLAALWASCEELYKKSLSGPQGYHPELSSGSRRKLLKENLPWPFDIISTQREPVISLIDFTTVIAISHNGYYNLFPDEFETVLIQLVLSTFFDPVAPKA